MILLLQDCKLTKEGNESAEEWMANLRVNANECEYKERDSLWLLFRTPKKQSSDDRFLEDGVEVCINIMYVDLSYLCLLYGAYAIDNILCMLICLICVFCMAHMQ